MKKLFLTILMLVSVTTQSHAQLLVGDMNGDGALDVSDITALVSTILGNSSQQYISGDDIIIESRDYVDLDLPSGTLWATCNLCASRPEEYFDRFYAWGETAIHPDKSYRWTNYKYCNGEYNSLTKYCSDSSYGLNGFTDELTELETVDDVATAKWGKDWKMPTREQAQELIDECNWTWTTLNNVNGYRVQSKKSDRYIFLPACGLRWNEWLEGPGTYSGGKYWTKTLDKNSPCNAYCLFIDYTQNYGKYITVSAQSRDYGFQIRPVRAAE